MIPVNPDLTKYINFALSRKIYHPTLALCACVDAIFTGDDDPNNDKWWEFEYETVLQTIERLGYTKPNTNILGQIQCIAAIRNGKSFIDKEWNQYEKAVAALTGIPVLFYEKQNLPIENVLHAMRIMPQLGTIEYSDEVKHYIGCEAINDDIFWYPIKEVDDYLYQSLDRIKNTLGFKIEEIEKMREDVKQKFNSIRKEELDTIDFKEDSVTDQMCKRIMASILKFHQLTKEENRELNRFRDIRDGKIPYDFNSMPKDPGEDYSDVEAGDEFNITLDNTGEVTHYEDGVNPDDPAEIEILDFNDGVKEASLEMLAEAQNEFVPAFEDMYHGQAMKIASFAMNGLEALPGVIGLMEKMASEAMMFPDIPDINLKMAAIPHPIGSSAISVGQPIYKRSKTLEQKDYVDPQELGIYGGPEADELQAENLEGSNVNTELKVSEASLKAQPTIVEASLKAQPTIVEASLKAQPTIVEASLKASARAQEPDVSDDEDIYDMF